MARIGALTILLLSTCIPQVHATEPHVQQSSAATAPQKTFDKLIAKHAGLTFSQLAAQAPKQNHREHPSFNVAEAKFYNQTVDRLQLTDVEQQMLREKGFVSVDHDQRYGFGALYFA